MLREAEAGATTKELCRKYGSSEPTLYNWKAKYAGMTVSAGRIGVGQIGPEGSDCLMGRNVWSASLLQEQSATAGDWSH